MAGRVSPVGVRRTPKQGMASTRSNQRGAPDVVSTGNAEHQVTGRSCAATRFAMKLRLSGFQGSWQSARAGTCKQIHQRKRIAKTSHPPNSNELGKGDRLPGRRHSLGPASVGQCPRAQSPEGSSILSESRWHLGDRPCRAVCRRSRNLEVVYVRRRPTVL